MQSVGRAFRWLFTYLREARQEFQKINWPTRRQVIRSTSIVIAFSAAVSILLGGFDLIFDRVASRLFANPESGFIQDEGAIQAEVGSPTEEAGGLEFEGVAPLEAPIEVIPAGPEEPESE